MWHLHIQSPSRGQIPLLSASFSPVVFRGLVKCRSLELPPERVRFKGLGIRILTSKPGNSGADAQVTTLGETLSLGFLLYEDLRLWITSEFINSQVSSSLMIPTSPLVYLMSTCPTYVWLLWYPVTVIFPLTFPTNSTAPFLSLDYLSGTKEPSRIILTFDR